jgi:immunity protein, SdpI family
MNSRLKVVIVSLWLFLPLVAFRNWQLWNRLPARMATHFDINNHPNGWMSREGQLEFVLIFMTIMLVVCTIVLSRVRVVRASSWATLGIFYVVLGALYCGEESILGYNLSGSSVHALAISIGTLVAVFLLTAIYLGTARGEQLPTTAHVLADEVHASPTVAFVLFVPALIELIIATTVPAAVRIVLVLTAIVLIGAAVMAWEGFEYVFTSSGLEIRTLGFRLRSIPAAQITDYRIAGWNALRGYGIRGIGNRRAYVWGNHGVRINTMDGEIFLGHRDPARIIHDLDAIKQFAH